LAAATPNPSSPFERHAAEFEAKAAELDRRAEELEAEMQRRQVVNAV
jgi:hypothetical protein